MNPIVKYLTRNHFFKQPAYFIGNFITSFQSSVSFHVKTSHLIWTTNQMTGFHMKYNTGLIWVNRVCNTLKFRYCLKSRNCMHSSYLWTKSLILFHKRCLTNFKPFMHNVEKMVKHTFFSKYTIYTFSKKKFTVTR